MMRRMTAIGLLVALVMTACSVDDAVVVPAPIVAPTTSLAITSPIPTTTTTPEPTTTVPTTAPSTAASVDLPAGPAADVAEELTGGDGVFLAGATAGTDLIMAGLVEEEFVAAGTAVSYRGIELPSDGRFVLAPAGEAEYRTRIVVRRPESAGDFNGTVVVEWLNVSGGLDAAPDRTNMNDELLRSGYVWVGVSSQRIGIESGPVAVATGSDLAGMGLKAIDAARYGSLQHPGDAFSYDVFSQVGRALRAGGALGGLRPERLLAVGESQSAFALTTYVNGVQPLTEVYDGFILHSRGGAPAPLGEGGRPMDVAASLSGPPTIVRTDGDAPVLVVQTETDLVSIFQYHAARQADSERFRLWEIAGTAHADRFMLGGAADSVGCSAPINDGPQRFVVSAALRSLDTWVRTGDAPPMAARLEIEVSGGSPVIVRDADGIALGGIRTPLVDVPAAVLSGEPGPTPSIICLLLGSTMPLSDDRLVELHGDTTGYLEAFETATDAAIEAGFVLAEDREAMLAEAQPDLVP